MCRLDRRPFSLNSTARRVTYAPFAMLTDDRRLLRTFSRIAARQYTAKLVSTVESRFSRRFYADFRRCFCGSPASKTPTVNYWRSQRLTTLPNVFLTFPLVLRHFRVPILAMTSSNKRFADMSVVILVRIRIQK